ncbi:hypothetical protein [Streptomyces sp. NPDC001970]
MEGTQFGRDGRRDLVHPILVPGRAEPHGLREDRRHAAPGDAVQRLGTDPEGGDAQAWHRRRVLMQHGEPLIECEPFQQIVDTLVDR